MDKQQIQIDKIFLPIILKALGEYQYNVALKLNALKGQAMTKTRKELTDIQKKIEELQSQLNTN